MRVAVVGSRSLTPEISLIDKFMPESVTEIVSGGAVGVDSLARAYADYKSLPIKEFLPEYEKFGRSAPIRRNIQIIDYADFVLIFWDGQSKGSEFVIERCKKIGKPTKLIKVRYQ